MKLAIGLMSGTSMDGIDAALIKTDGENVIEEIASISIPYDAEVRNILKESEARIRYSHIKENEVEKLSTTLHIQAVCALLEKAKYQTKDIDVIGYHGQTMYHNPEQKLSIILGNGAHMAKVLGIDVVNDFRARDIELGGRGAPFAPLYHLALAKRDNKIPVAIVNCGGIANITIINSADPHDLIAYDTGPGNGLVDRLVHIRTNGKEHMDRDGQYGKNGMVHENILELLYKKSTFKNGMNFFDQTGPKALDINDMQLIPELNELSLEDACRTLEAFTADSIVRSLKNYRHCEGDKVQRSNLSNLTEIATHFQGGARNDEIPTHWILAGGGWNNPVILSELKARLNGSNVMTASEVGWDNAALEAQIFAYFAVRSLKGLPLSFPNTTGVSEATSGGIVYYSS